MHMADALISPPVGGTLWIVSAGLIAFCARRVRNALQDRLVPMMGVLGAFVFAAQMVNFPIPWTGSSGHLGGGLLLAILLGPHAAFLVIASVLTVQAFFFADGGLLALGCNIFNLGFFPAFVAYPLIYRVIAGNQHAPTRAWMATTVAAVAGLQLGAMGVVMETTASGISDLPFGMFALMMSPIHLAIGVVEGTATAAIVSFVARARPDVVQSAARGTIEAPGSLRPVMIGLAIAAVIVGGAFSWLASAYPDGLEWSIAGVTGKREQPGLNTGLHRKMGALQKKTAFLPGYGFKSAEETTAPASPAPESWPDVNAGTSVSGIVGGLITLVLVCTAGFALKARPGGRVARNRST